MCCVSPGHQATPPRVAIAATPARVPPPDLPATPVTRTMTPRPLPLLLAVLLLLSACRPACAAASASSAPTKWHFVGLGRTVHLFSPNVTSSSHLFLLTALGTVAHVDIHSATVHWRLAPPLHAAGVHPTAAATLGDDVPSLLLVLTSDHMLRAVDPLRRAVLWQVPACQLGVVRRAGIVPIAACDGSLHALSATTGTAMPGLPAEDHPAHHQQPPFEPVPPLDLAPSHLSWSLSRADGGHYSLLSEPDGALRLLQPHATANDERPAREVWRREDGVAHVTSGSIFFLQSASDSRNSDQQGAPGDPGEHSAETLNSSPSASSSPSSQLSPGTAVVVVLSNLGTLFALSDASTVMWKLSVPGRCNLLENNPDALAGHAVLVCLHGGDDEKSPPDISTRVQVISIRSGKVEFSKSKQNFHATKASIEPCCSQQNSGGGFCIAAIDASGQEQWFSSCGQSRSQELNSDVEDYAKNSDDTLPHNIKQSPSERSAGSASPSSDRGWLVYSIGGQVIQGMRNGKMSWKVATPNAATIVSVTSKQHYASVSKLRPAPVRVTATRDLLYKYVDEDVLLVLAHDASAAELYAMVIDGRSGSLYEVRAHRSVASTPTACGVGGDHWFVYSFWNAAILQQEVHILDMYHDADVEHSADGKKIVRVHAWVGETVRAAVRALFGRNIMYALGIPDPDFAVPCIKDGGIELDIDINSSVTASGSDYELRARSQQSEPSSSSSGSGRAATGDDTMRCSSPYEQRWHRQQYHHHHQHQQPYHEREQQQKQQQQHQRQRQFQQQPRSQRTTRRKPVFFASDMLLTQRVTSLSVTETINGITEAAIILTLESGQVTLVPKFLLDTLRPSDGSPASEKVHRANPIPPMQLPKYRPVLNVEPSSRESSYFAKGFHMPGGVKKVAVTPCRVRESCSIMAVLGMDIVFGSVQPVGSFDTLPREDFAYSAVVGMILILVTGVLYTNRIKARVGLKKVWK